MQIVVMATRSYPKSAGGTSLILRPDNWNDYGFTTLYDLFFDDGHGEIHQIGGVKIAHSGQVKHAEHIKPGRYAPLGNLFFSVGQDDSYYQKIQAFGGQISQDILQSLRDIAFDPEAYVAAIKEDVTQISLFRQVNSRMVTGQFRRIAQGGPVVETYRFQYTLPQLDRTGEHPQLDFFVRPSSDPPTNLHVLIGRNGVGKTSLLRNLVRTLVTDGKDKESTGTVTSSDSNGIPFVNLVMIAFSAFDPFHEFEANNDRQSAISFSHVGLNSMTENRSRDTGNDVDGEHSLDLQFVESLQAVIATRKYDRWLRAIETLESDPIFKSYELASLINEYSNGGTTTTEGAARSRRSGLARDTFNELSSGHKIVLLTITRAVEKVTERTLVLLDEPESHLHPPLLSSLLRALSELLSERNGVAFIATHSPVVLQEVPRSCVWTLRRHGNVLNAERPGTETFGENVGLLTHEVFGLEVEGSGFHKELRKAVEVADNYEDVISKFDGQLGSEARGIARILTADKTALRRPL